jgi:hypothetical protein
MTSLDHADDRSSTASINDRISDRNDRRLNGDSP